MNDWQTINDLLKFYFPFRFAVFARLGSCPTCLPAGEAISQQMEGIAMGKACSVEVENPRNYL